MKEIRYEDVTEKEYEILKMVREQYFQDFEEAQIKILFDTKKRALGGKIVLAKIYKANDLVRHLTLHEIDISGVDYIIFLDKVCWTLIQDIDKIRILRHEMRHVEITSSETNPWGLKGHDIEDFESEVALNQDDIGWNRRVANLTELVYQQLKEKEKEKEDKKVAKAAAKPKKEKKAKKAAGAAAVFQELPVVKDNTGDGVES